MAAESLSFWDLKPEHLRTLVATSLDYRFHFVPWWADPGYALPDASVVIGPEDARYFEGLQAQGIRLSPSAQKRWWVKKGRDEGAT